MSRKKIFVLDTSVFLTNAECVYEFQNNDIVIPFKVLEEIDKHKGRQDGVGAQARKIIRILDALRSKGTLFNGIRIRKGAGLLYAWGTERLGAAGFPDDLDSSIPDHLIIATAMAVQKEYPTRKVIMVSRDINMRVICDSVGLLTDDYIVERAVKDSESIYKGYTSYLIDDATIDRFYAKEEIYLEPEDVAHLNSNQYLMLVSNANEKKTALCRYISPMEPLKPLLEYKKGVWGIKPRNKEQAFALDLLMDPRIQLITLIGKAGSGKTLCAIAAGLQQTMEDLSAYDTENYSRLIVSRPVQPLGKDIGFLPGSMEEKMTPWLMPIQDNLQFLMGNDKLTLEMYMQRGKIELEALTYIRGRSISNSFIIIDEAQNLTIHELKTIITRVGEGTKIILTGDVEQIDTPYINETTNGLTHAVEKFKKFELAGHITLSKGERSRVATYAAKCL
jgi:PhoH-like ATPase